MSTDGESQRSDWEENVGLSQETTYVALYPNREHAEEWKAEAEEQGYSSRSKYIYELIQEARAFRQEGFLAYDRSESEIEQLHLEIEQLEEQLADHRAKEPGEIPIEHEEFVTAFLTDSYQPFESVVTEITESGVLTGIVKDAIEDQLFDLAEAGKVEYKQGYGWRLTHDAVDQEAVSA